MDEEFLEPVISASFNPSATSASDRGTSMGTDCIREFSSAHPESKIAGRAIINNCLFINCFVFYDIYLKISEIFQKVLWIPPFAGAPENNA